MRTTLADVGSPYCPVEPLPGRGASRLAIGLLLFTLVGASFAQPLPAQPGHSGPIERTPDESASPSTSLQRGRVRAPSGRIFDVEVVSDEQSRQNGLKHRSSIPPDTGMLFVFPVAGRYHFWMYECLTPLDIIWLDAEGRVIHIAERLPICSTQPCPNYGPDKDALYVLEVGPGVAGKAGIHPGAKLGLLFADPPHAR